MLLALLLILALSVSPALATDYLVFIPNEDGSYRNSNALWKQTAPRPGFDIPDSAVVIEYPGQGMPDGFTYVDGDLIYTKVELAPPPPLVKSAPPAPLKLDATYPNVPKK